MLCALMMAGGKGTRFWPISTEEKPKQFLKLLGEKSMIRMTVDRLLPIIPIDRIFIATSEQYVNLVKEEIPELSEDNIIVEPVGRNTAPCIALSAFYINKRIDNASMVVVPADHLIRDEESFQDTIIDGYKFLQSHEESIITIGILPTRPETGYGYIECGTENEPGILEVSRFVEKPDIETAMKYISRKNYLWNSGMFIWTINNILNLINKHLKNTYNILSEVAVAREEEYEDALIRKYKDVDNISIDFGVMEKADSIYVIPGNFGWDDIGSWSAIERYREKDNNNNICSNNVKIVDGRNNIILGEEKNIIVDGLENIYLIESKDVIILGSKDKIENIKSLKELNSK